MTQRTYRAACPNCGAPVEFRSASEALAVCGFCRSTLVRDGDTLQRLGRMAEVFDDRSPIRLGVTGTVPADLAKDCGLRGPFTVAGRLQYRYAGGSWSEWHLLFDDGGSGWLSEDNGQHALMRDAGPQPKVPAPEAFAPDRQFELAGGIWRVASLTQISALAGEGELPPQSLSRVRSADAPAFRVADLRAAGGRLLSIDWSEPAAPRVFVGCGCTLAQLDLKGLADETGPAAKGRATDCPSCGAPLAPKFDFSVRCTCERCGAVVDLSEGVGGQLAFARQAQRFKSPIPLGSTGTLDGIAWQAVGFSIRSGVDADGERFRWTEVILWEPKQGFAFLVLSQSAPPALVRVLSGAPPAPGPLGLKYDGRRYGSEPGYDAQVDYVEGEFYWRVQVGERTRNVDWRSGAFVLSREEAVPESGSGTAGDIEVTWSAGRDVPATEVARAFGLDRLETAPQARIAFDPSKPYPGRGAGTAGGLGAGAAGAAGAAMGAMRPPAAPQGPLDAAMGSAADGPLLQGGAGDDGSGSGAPGEAGGGGAGGAAGTGAGGQGAPRPAADRARDLSSAASGGGGLGGGSGGGRGLGGGGGGSPWSGSAGLWTVILIVVFIVVLFLIFSDDDDGGGSYGSRSGGWSSGAHK